MAKTNKPFMSLASKGTIGGAITTQKRGTATLIREKPTPTDPKSLAQMYQRWLYQDCTYYWHSLTQAERDAYRPYASRYNTTPFAYFLKQKLKTMPDMAAIWHLDEITGATARDSSPNENHLTHIGSLPADGVIDGGRYYDGVDDYSYVVGNASLDMSVTNKLTLECFLNLIANGNDYSGVVGTYGEYYKIYIDPLTRKVFGWLKAADGTAWSVQITADYPTGWHHLAFTYNKDLGTENLKGYIDGQLTNTQNWAKALRPLGAAAVQLNSHRLINCYIDEARIANRPLTQPQLQDHAERRYPL